MIANTIPDPSCRNVFKGHHLLISESCSWRMFVQFFKWHQDILFVMMPDESRNDANNLEMHLRTRLMRARTSACMPSIAFAQSFGITLHRLRFLRPCTIDSRTFREKTSANVKHKVVCAVDFLRFWPWVKNYFGGLRFLVPHLCKILYNNGLGSMCARRQAKYRMLRRWSGQSQTLFLSQNGPHRFTCILHV